MAAITKTKIRRDTTMQEGISAAEAMLSGGLGVAVLGWIHQAIMKSKEKRELKIEHLENRLSDIDKCLVRQESTLKRTHDRLDRTDALQNKLETKIDSDIQEVKHSIEKLSNLIIERLSKQGN